MDVGLMPSYTFLIASFPPIGMHFMHVLYLIVLSARDSRDAAGDGICSLAVLLRERWCPESSSRFDSHSALRHLCNP